jgi:DNA-binding transcriptional LysR family regulator
MLHALDLDLIRTFLTVVAEGGLKPAASQLNKTPSAISMQIKRLEEQLGQRVLERNNKGINLTNSGRILKERGELLIRMNNELLADMRETEWSGPITIGAPSDYAPTLLQKLLPMLRIEFPRLEPNVVLEPSRILRKRVQAGEIAAAIVAKEPQTSEGNLLWSETINWYGPVYPKNEPTRVAILSTDCILRDAAYAMLQKNNLNYKIVLESSAVSSLRDAVKADFCTALLPGSMVSGLEKRNSIGLSNLKALEFVLITAKRIKADQSTNLYRRLKWAMGELKH